MKKTKKQWVYWTDKVADEVRKKVDKEPILKKIVKKRGYIVYDEKTASGKIHVGAARGWIIHDIIAKTMRDHGMKARFILSSDNMDPLDTVPAYLKQEKFKKFLGVPLRDTPSPEKGYDNYADYFFSQCTEKFEDFGIEAEIELTGDRYDKGDFNKTIRIALDNADKIKTVYKRIYGQTAAMDKLPFCPICEKCGKIGTTLAYEWDPDNGMVKYVCEPSMVDWAQGCGHRGEVSPFNGNGKMPWKVEWAAKWPTVGVVCETAGKDHFTKGGSRTISVAISCEVFKFPPPYPSTCKEIGRGYEFFLVGGKKMSTSRGLGVSFVEVSDLVPAEMLRFLMVKTRPETTIEFTPEGNTLPFLFNEFDKIERIYFGLEKVGERDKTNARRVYELSTIDKIPKKKPFRISFDFASMLAQALPEKNRLERSIQILKKTGHIDRKLTKFERDELKKRLDYAELWSRELAPDNMKVILLKKLPEDIMQKLSDKQGSALKDLSQFLKTDRKDKEIWSRIREVATKEGIDSKKVFQAAYLVLLGRPYGPRLIPFIQSLDKSFIKKRFELKDVVKVIPKKEIVVEVVEVEKPVKKEIRMITRPLFWEDAYMKEFDATVTEIVGNRVVLDQTCFYGESGGQAGDTGEIGKIKVIDSKKEHGKIIHIIEKEPSFKVGDKIHGKIDWDRRYRIMQLHAASHVMEFFLFKTFGEKKRIGSFVNDEKDRSDYRVETKITSEGIKKVEDLCNEFISRNLEIKRWEDPERHEFWIWESGEIKEYCGGTHVKNTKEIGKIKLKIKNLGAGKQRIETYLANER